jgi:hypothetical protein
MNGRGRVLKAKTWAVAQPNMPSSSHWPPSWRSPSKNVIEKYQYKDHSQGPERRARPLEGEYPDLRMVIHKRKKRTLQHLTRWRHIISRWLTRQYSYFLSFALIRLIPIITERPDPPLVHNIRISFKIQEKATLLKQLALFRHDSLL